MRYRLNREKKLSDDAENNTAITTTDSKNLPITILISGFKIYETYYYYDYYYYWLTFGVVKKSNTVVSARPVTTAVQWTPEYGKRRRGRPNKTWQDTLHDDLFGWEDARSVVGGHKEWRSLIGQCSTGNRGSKAKDLPLVQLRCALQAIASDTRHYTTLNSFNPCGL